MFFRAVCGLEVRHGTSDRIAALGLLASLTILIKSCVLVEFIGSPDRSRVVPWLHEAKQVK